MDGRREVRWRWIAIVVALGVAAVAIWWWVSGAAEPYVEEEALRERIESWGVWGPIGYVGSMWLIQPLGVPGVVFMVPASLVWSAPVAIGLSWVGNLGASWIAFEVTRGIGRDWVSERIPDRLRRFDERLAAGGWWPVFGLRILTGQIPAADWMLGVSSVDRRSFLVGTGLGILPGIVVVVAFGGDLIAWLRDNRGVGLVLLVFAVGRRIVARWWRRRSDGAPS